MLKNKKNIMFIIIGIILFILYSVALVFIFDKVNKCSDKILYKYFDDSMIEINNEDENIDVKANIIDSYKLIGMIIDSKYDKKVIATVNTKYYDSDNNEISSNTQKIFINKKRKEFITFKLPDKEYNFAGKIKININYNDTDLNVEAIPDINFNLEVGGDQYDNLHVNLKWNNNLGKDIKSISGVVAVVKDDKIITYKSFTYPTIAAGSNLLFFETFYGTPKDGITQDDIQVFIYQLET